MKIERLQPWLVKAPGTPWGEYLFLEVSGEHIPKFQVPARPAGVSKQTANTPQFLARKTLPGSRASAIFQS